MSKRHSGRCGQCGEHRRLCGWGLDGKPTCERCRKAHQRAAADQRYRESILTSVSATEPELGQAAVADALRSFGGSCSLRRLARYLANHPAVLREGPTSTVPFLDRFTKALTQAGARNIRTIHPPCAVCGRQMHPCNRRGEGWVCGACWARAHIGTCVQCGRLRRIEGRDRDGNPLCAGCTLQDRRHREADALIEHVVGTLAGMEPWLTHAEITRVVESVVGVRCRCANLTLLTTALTLSPGSRGQPIWVKLLLSLHAAGARNLPWPTCHCCGAALDEHAVVRAKEVTCRPCAQQICTACGRPCGPRRHLCSRCKSDRSAARRRGLSAPLRGTCADCARSDQRLDRNGRCSQCRQRAARRCTVCGTPPPHTFVEEHRLCIRCGVERLLAKALAGATEAGPLEPLRAAIRAAADQKGTLNWLRRSRAALVLTDLASGRIPLTHDGLDTLGPNRAIEHLRALLVASGALPADHRPVARLEATARELLGTLDHPDRRTLAAWVRWKLVPGVRRRAEAGHDAGISAANGRRALHEVLRFLLGLHQAGRELATCTQADVDRWFAQPGAAQWDIRSFLVWCRRHQHLPALDLPSGRHRGLPVSGDPEGRWALARRLVMDEGMDVADRVAGALVVLYGQPLVSIVRLAAADVYRDGSRVTVVVGRARFEIHEPFGTLVAQLPVRRTRGVRDQFDNPWLFPGARPGHHLRPGALGHRLRRLGIRPRDMRTAARVQLAAEIPPALLAEILGVTPQTAVVWTAASGGNWTQYVARQNPERPSPQVPDGLTT